MRQSQIALLGGRWERRASHAGEGGVQRSCLQLDFTCDALTITPSPLQGCQRRPPGSRDRSRRTIDRVKYDAPDAEAGSKGSLAARHHQLRGLLDKKWQLELPLATGQVSLPSPSRRRLRTGDTTHLSPTHLLNNNYNRHDQPG
jgi:hypothetical protein